MVTDIRVLKKILILYLPLPLFWSLFDQQGSRWTLQAKTMNGEIGFYTVKPDQIQMVNPLLILTLIPAFEAVVYPFLNKINLGRPLQRLTIGGILAGVSFILSALVQIWIDASPENSVNILWQVPQYVVLTMGEVMFSGNRKNENTILSELFISFPLPHFSDRIIVFIRPSTREYEIRRTGIALAIEYFGFC